jgi:hypothetical protein
MEHTRLKNMAICRRKLPQIPVPDLVKLSDKELVW